ncbi:MAG TPA: type II secretion system F family protein [bacterium]|nr:type II secretion system F family protein [bacterium]
MPTFHYRARDRDGVLITGEIEAVSADELKEGLFREGMVPLEVGEVGKGSFSLKSLEGLFGRVKPEDLMIFTRQFYTLFKAGVSMDTIFSTMAKQSTSSMMCNALVRIRADIAAGAMLSQAFARHPKIFNELYVSMLAAGEEAGILETVLKNLSELLQRDFEIQKNIKGATLYPKIVLTVLILAVMFLMTFVVPKFTAFYSRYGAELPLPTKILIGVSSFFRYYWFVAIGIFAAMVIAYRRFYRTHVGRLKVDRFKFRMPVFGPLNLKVANARFGHILSALYRSGLAMPRSLEVVANVIGNLAFALEIQKVRDEIQRGATLSESLSHQQFFPPVIIETTAVGERAGALGDMLSTVAEHYELEVSHTVKNLTTLLEPLLLVGIFAAVTLLALAIFLPIWNLSSVIGG